MVPVRLSPVSRARAYNKRLHQHLIPERVMALLDTKYSLHIFMQGRHVVRSKPSLSGKMDVFVTFEIFECSHTCRAQVHITGIQEPTSVAITSDVHQSVSSLRAEGKWRTLPSHQPPGTFSADQGQFRACHACCIVSLPVSCLLTASLPMTTHQTACLKFHCLVHTMPHHAVNT
jgi:hypothetical protein